MYIVHYKSKGEDYSITFMQKYQAVLFMRKYGGVLSIY